LRVVGIDPGSANCGVALVEGDQAIAALKLSSVAGMIDPAQLARLVLEWKPDAAAIERVGARPLQGRSSRSVAARLYPSMDFSKKNSIDAAEALLIARYAHERILI
jgi:RNase H-fold protein (predicted Holliday junction resolvase)